MTAFEAAAIPGEPPPADSVAPRDSTADAPTSVARLNGTIRDFIARWNTVWVEGVITSWNVRVVNVFGRLNDTQSDAQLSFLVWCSVCGRMTSARCASDQVAPPSKPYH